MVGRLEGWKVGRNLDAGREGAGGQGRWAGRERSGRGLRGEKGAGWGCGGLGGRERGRFLDDRAGAACGPGEGSGESSGGAARGAEAAGPGPAQKPRPGSRSRFPALPSYRVSPLQVALLVAKGRDVDLHGRAGRGAERRAGGGRARRWLRPRPRPRPFTGSAPWPRRVAEPGRTGPNRAEPGRAGSSGAPGAAPWNSRPESHARPRATQGVGFRVAQRRSWHIKDCRAWKMPAL
jgi:hypothetical protein